MVCDTANSRCVRCLGDADCTFGGNTCEINQYRNRCVRSCASDDDCGGRGFCNTDTSRCVMCNVNADCTRGDATTCSNNRCVACTADADCADGFCLFGRRCMPFRGTGERCVTNEWCSSGNCNAYFCT